MASMTDPAALERPQLMLVPGGTTPGAVTMTYAAIHKLWEFYERWENTGELRKNWIIVAPREMTECLPSRAEASNAALQARIKQMPPSVDVIVETSGSTTGQPSLAGLSFGALVASARATHEVLSGPGRWIVALPVHHIAGLHTLVRCCVAGTSPVIADMSGGFDADALRRAALTVAQDDLPTYLSLVPKQLAEVLAIGGELVEELSRLDAILVGGSHLRADLFNQARAAGLPIVTTYGMSETCGGCVYDGRPLPGVDVRVRDERIEIAGPVLMETYVDQETTTAFIFQDGKKWLKTADLGRMEDGILDVLGRADDVIVSGGLNLSPTSIEEALCNMETIRDAVVVALPDDVWGEVATALIVPEVSLEDPHLLDGVTMAAADEATTRLAKVEEVDLETLAIHIRREVGAQLGREHAPRVIALTDHLPTTPLGKPDRAAVVAMVTDFVERGRAWVR